MSEEEDIRTARFFSRDRQRVIHCERLVQLHGWARRQRQEHEARPEWPMHLIVASERDAYLARFGLLRSTSVDSKYPIENHKNTNNVQNTRPLQARRGSNSSTGSSLGYESGDFSHWVSCQTTPTLSSIRSRASSRASTESGATRGHSKGRLAFDDACVFFDTLSNLRRVPFADPNHEACHELEILIQQQNDIEEDEPWIDRRDANDHGRTALHKAAAWSHLGLAKWCLLKEARIDLQDSMRGWTALHIAAHFGHVPVMQLLLEHGAHVAILDDQDQMPIHVTKFPDAIDLLKEEMKRQGYDEQKVEQLRTSTADRLLRNVQQYLKTFNVVFPFDTPMPRRRGYWQSMSSRSLDLSWICYQRHNATLLHVCASRGYIAVLRLLLKQGALPDVRDRHGWTPLHAAACWCQWDAVECLLKFGANPLLVTRNGHSAADLCDDDHITVLLQNAERKPRMKRIVRSLSLDRARK